MYLTPSFDLNSSLLPTPGKSCSQEGSGAKRIKQKKIPHTKHSKRRCLSKLPKEFVYFLLRSSRSSVGILKGKQRASDRFTLSHSSEYRAGKVEEVVTPPQGDAKISLILSVQT